MSSLGDLFHALPAVRALKTGLGATVDWVAHDSFVEVVRCFTDVERVISFPRARFWDGIIEFRAELRRHAYDYVFDLQGLLKSALVTGMARARRRVGPSFRREGAGLFYDVVAGAKNKNRHAVEECRDSVRFLGLPVGEAEFPVTFPEYPAAPHYPRVSFLPCSRRREKNWPPDRFVEVGRELVKKRGAAIYLVGGAADTDACSFIASKLEGRIHNLAGRTSLPELGGLLKQMDLMVTVDSGPMHMAAALGIPVVAVFGPTFPERTGPYGSSHRVIKQGERLDQLPSAPVTEAALSFLS